MTGDMPVNQERGGRSRTMPTSRYEENSKAGRTGSRTFPQDQHNFGWLAALGSLEKLPPLPSSASVPQGVGLIPFLHQPLGQRNLRGGSSQCHSSWRVVGECPSNLRRRANLGHELLKGLHCLGMW